MDELRNLIGGKGLKVLPSGEELPEKTPEVPVVSNSLPAPTATQLAIEKIVSEISGVKEKQLARSLLNEIDRSDYISFDPDNLEIIVDGENIKFSNIKNLVQYCILANPSHLPLAIALFLQCMIRIKIPSELLRHGDALGNLPLFHYLTIFMGLMVEHAMLHCSPAMQAFLSKRRQMLPGLIESIWHP